MPQEVAGGFVGVSRRISGLEELAFCQVEGWLVTIQPVNLGRQFPWPPKLQQTMHWRRSCGAYVYFSERE